MCLKTDLDRLMRVFNDDGQSVPQSVIGLLGSAIIMFCWPAALLLALLDPGPFPAPPRYSIGLLLAAACSILLGGLICVGVVRRRAWTIAMALIALGMLVGALLVAAWIMTSGMPRPLSVWIGLLPGVAVLIYVMHCLISPPMLAWFGIALLPTASEDRRTLTADRLTVHTPGPVAEDRSARRRRGP
ncbi:MAG: hypothetical protein RLY86_1520 [Pseudomonadota bacterium]|jgi:hypothetical protein